MFVCILIIAGGCDMRIQEENRKPSEMKLDELPEAPAFKDDFTRGFLQSAEPVREGYYPFLSESESFTMDFPEEMKVEYRSHFASSDNERETVEIRNVEKNRNVHVHSFMQYYRSMGTAEDSMRMMSASADKDLNFKKIETAYENQYLDVAEFQYDENNHTILAIVWNEAGQQIQISLMARCLDSEEMDRCEPLTKEDREKIMEQFKSIELILPEND